jgi:hypothetical protein
LDVDNHPAIGVDTPIVLEIMAMVAIVYLKNNLRCIKQKGFDELTPLKPLN